ncbi:MAG: methionine--tRNA ligase [Candidatus Eisenbacteria bacterium]|nr:methionine--tRNA ligase [Candidatus Eisenbacteria bacterium]
MSRYYLTTAIDYANGAPHLGHTYEKVVADGMARFQRLMGVDTWFQIGMDEHGQKVAQTAEKEGVDPQVFCDRMAETYTTVWAAMDISHDAFVRTTDETHMRGVQHLFAKCHERGDIYQGHYEGLYCVGCEAYYLEKDLVEGLCPVHRTPPRAVTEENYFFRLSKYAEPLLAHLEAHPGFIEPEIRRNEVLNVIRGGLDDVSVSRANLAWGVPLPMDPKHTVYVWFDALLNYATGVGLGQETPSAREKWARWWPADCHVIGKDITRFHCIIWPAMLMSAGIPLPRSVYAHGWIQSPDGARFSKSAGNVVDPVLVGRWLREVAGEGLRAEIQHEPLRYFLMREVPMGRDGEFSRQLFVERYNADLANELGNLLNRGLSMVHRYFGGALDPAGPVGAPEQAIGALAAEVIANHRKAMGSWQFSVGLQEAWRLVKAANQYVAETEPWTLAKDPANRARLARVLSTVLEALRVTAALVAPAMPRTAAVIGADLGLAWPSPDALRDLAWRTDPLPAGHAVGKAVVLFPRVDVSKLEAAAAITESPKS